MADPSRPPLSSIATGTLVGSSLSLAGLAVYQWLELVAARSGTAPACAINATVNCATVWDSPFATTIHATLGLPIAALGLVYGLVALALPTAILLRPAADPAPFFAGIKVTALVGALSCITLLTASLSTGALCLTCVGTYLLTAVYAFGAFRLLPGPAFPRTEHLVPGAAWSLVLAVPVYLVLLFFGGGSPSRTGSAMAASSPDGFERMLESASQRERLFTAYARAQWQAARFIDNSMFPVRVRGGAPGAPVHIVDFTDMLCGHCAQFEQTITDLLASAPPGSLSVEPRHFPLDAECNPYVQRNWGDGIRCVGAKVQICLEEDPSFFKVRHSLFENQSSLSVDRIYQLAVQGSGVPRSDLEACVASASTAGKLRQDVEYAQRYNIQGTPMVLLNGKETPPAPLFILGMAITRGDASAPAFQRLPPPPTP